MERNDRISRRKWGDGADEALKKEENVDETKKKDVE